MKKLNVFLIGIIIVIISCAQPAVVGKEEFSEEMIKEAVTFCIDSFLINSKHKGDFFIAPDFINTLDSAFFWYYIELDSIYTSKDFISMRSQYELKKNDSLKNYIGNSELLSTKRPHGWDLYYDLSPPIFNSDTTRFFIYAITHFEKVNSSELGWDQKIFVFRYDNGQIKVDKIIRFE